MWSHLDDSVLQHDEAVVDLAGDEDEEGLGPARPEPEGDVRGRAGVPQRQGDVARPVEGGWKRKRKRC